MKGWKTLLMNGVSIAILLFTWEGIGELIDPRYAALGLAVANAILRFFTTTPVGSASQVKGLAVLLPLLLAGCATDSALRDFTAADARQAQEWAQADGDTLAATCYQTLAEIAESGALITLAERTPIGALTADYLIRSVRRAADNLAQSTLREKLLLGCAPYAVDKRDVLLRLGLKILPLVP
jgi:hypothetical protein